jgi:hypothetical protein
MLLFIGGKLRRWVWLKRERGWRLERRGERRGVDNGGEMTA